jgi:hypothetical protein
MGLDRGAEDALSILYLTKFPPSPSGIALYAAKFHDPLQRLGTVELRTAPASPAQSQALVASVFGFFGGIRASRCGKYKLFFGELGGRGLYEFYFLMGVALGSRFCRISFTCHDAPSLVGPCMLFGALDRRGGRRIGLLLSRTVGATMEAFLMRRADCVFALTKEAASVLGTRYNRSVSYIPHVVDEPALGSKEPIVFMPGYIGSAAPIIDAVRTLQHVGYVCGCPWRLRVGACSEHVEQSVRSVVRDQSSGYVEFVGFLTEAELLGEFERATVVLRIVGSGGKGNALAASGPLNWAIARGCVCVTDDNRAGARELAAEGLVTVSQTPIRALAALLVSDGMGRERARDIARTSRMRSGPDAVARRLSEVLR